MKNPFFFCMLVCALTIFAEEKENPKMKSFKFKLNPGDIIFSFIDDDYGNARSEPRHLIKDAYSIENKDLPILSLKVISPEGYSKNGLMYKIIFRKDWINKGTNYESSTYTEVPIEYLVKDSFMEEIRAPDFEMLAEWDEKRDITVYTIPIVVVKDKVHVLKLYFAKDLTVLKSTVNLPKGSEDYLDSVMFRK